MPSSPNLSRIDFVINVHLEAAWRRAALERLDPVSSIRIEQNKLELILGCDPSPSRRYGAWLARWRRHMWPIAGLRSMAPIEELDALTSALEAFDTLITRLPPSARDINQYRNAWELLSAQQAPTSQTMRSRRLKERTDAYAGSEMLFAEGQWRLVKLKTIAAAVWWGQGTRWCTSSRTDNAFGTYIVQGDLMVLITPSGRYQLATGTGEFRDAADAQVTLSAVLSAAPSALRQMLCH